MDIRAAEISSILREQIKNFGREAEVSEVGQVLSVGDGIARVYGLDNVQAGEMVEFPGGTRGMASDIEIQAREIIKMNERLNKIFADATGQPIEKIAKDTDRDYWLSAKDAIEYGLVSRIVTSQADI